MRRVSCLSTIALSCVATAALGSDPGGRSYAGATPENPLVCKRDRHTQLGSHFRAQRTCMLRSAWREQEELTRHELQQIMDGRAANLGPIPVPGPGLDRPGPNPG